MKTQPQALMDPYYVFKLLFLNLGEILCAFLYVYIFSVV